MAFSSGRASDAHSTGIGRAAKESWMVVVLDWKHGVSIVETEQRIWTCFLNDLLGFPKACSTHFQPLASFGGFGYLTQKHMIHGKSCELVFQGSILQVAKGKSYANGNGRCCRLFMMSLISSLRPGNGIHFMWPSAIVATEGLGELTGC